MILERSSVGSANKWSHVSMFDLDLGVPRVGDG